MDGFTDCGFQWRAATPYPAVSAGGRSSRYAGAMLENLGGRVSELTAVTRYVYGHFITGEFPEVGEAFRQISIVEMHHMEIFGALSRQLGAQPRFWAGGGGRMNYWTAGYLSYPQDVGGLLDASIAGERQAIRQYEQQTRWIKDANVVENLNRILEDERMHLEVFLSLRESCGGPQRRGHGSGR